MTIECQTVRGRWKAEEHDWERTGGLIWWKIHSGRENQKVSKSREASLAMSCMYRGLVRKRERESIEPRQRRIVFSLLISINMRQNRALRSPSVSRGLPLRPRLSVSLSSFFSPQKYPFVNSNGFQTDSHKSLKVTAIFSVPSVVWWCACAEFWFTYFLHFLTCGVQTSGRYGASS